MTSIRKMAIATIVIGVVATTPIASQAWNLICGVSINSETLPSGIPNKWDADSHALRGISLYFAGAAELQRIELGKNGEMSIPLSLLGSNMPVTDAGALDFLASSKEFEQAINMAGQYHLGDARGIESLQNLRKMTRDIFDSMQDGHLPTLNQIQDVTPVLNSYVSYGVELSKSHLQHGLTGHGIGGPDYPVRLHIPVSPK